MRAALFALSLALALPAGAETLSQEIARAGLTATEARLAVLPAPAPEDIFALGALQFLRVVEGTYQTRWQNGLSDPTGMLPFLRLPLDPNPAAAAFDPAIFRTLFEATAAGMTKAQATLATVPDTEFAVEIALADLWFDVNSDGARAPGEGLVDLLGPALLGWRWQDRDPAAPLPVIRFDTADAAWLAAYAHLLAGLSEVILAFDPTEPVSRIMAARTAMERLAPLDSDLFTGSERAPDTLDILAILIEVLDQDPDPARLASARAHFLGMVADNRRFWTAVEREADDNAEWLPNGRQTSALGLTLPPGTRAVWLSILSDAEAVLTGRKLLPYWRFGGKTAGLNLARYIDSPGRIDLAGWIHGWAALPWLQRGEVLSNDNWEAFEGLMSGDPMLMALWLN